jgi:DNA-binding transcriptional ArsR family regulator
MSAREEESRSRADLLAHPVRLRVIMALAGEQLTPQQIAAALSDVPQATLYRHINRLAEGGVLRVVRETPVRGAVEKVYALVEESANLDETDLAHATGEDHIRYFTVFFAAILGQLRSYFQQETANPRTDGLVCQGNTPYLTDAEYHRLLSDIGALLATTHANPRTPDRRRRFIGWVALPGPQAPDAPSEPSNE